MTMSLIIFEHSCVHFVVLFPNTEAVFYSPSKISGVLFSIGPLVNPVAFVFTVLKSTLELVAFVTSPNDHCCSFTMSDTAYLIAYVNFLDCGLVLYHKIIIAY